MLQIELGSIYPLALEASLSFSLSLLSYHLPYINFQKDKWVKMSCAVFGEPVWCPGVKVHSQRDSIPEGARGHVLLSNVHTHPLLASAGNSLQAQLRDVFVTKSVLNEKGSMESLEEQRVGDRIHSRGPHSTEPRAGFGFKWFPQPSVLRAGDPHNPTPQPRLCKKGEHILTTAKPSVSLVRLRHPGGNMGR